MQRSVSRVVLEQQGAGPPGDLDRMLVQLRQQFHEARAAGKQPQDGRGDRDGVA